MYERFTDRARKVIQLANEEAKRFRHEYVGTEHILLALILEGSGVAANVLKNLEISLSKVRREVEKIVQPGPYDVHMAILPQTPRAKKVIECAVEESYSLKHNYVGTEHLLLGLLKEQEGVAAQVLMNLGLRLDTVRKEVVNLLGFTVAPSEDALAARLGLEKIELLSDSDDEEDEPPPDEIKHLPTPAREIVAEFDCQINVIKEEKEQAVGNQAWEKAAKLRDLEYKLRQLRDEFISRWPKREAP